MTSGSRVFRRLIRLLFPQAFADAYGDELARTCDAQRREQASLGRARRVRFWIVLTIDLLRSAAREHRDEWRQDVRYAVRTLRRTPGFTLVAILTLALGIGASTAAFSIVDAVLVRRLPYPSPDRLVRIFEQHGREAAADLPASPPDVVDWQQQSRTLASIAVYRGRTANVAGRGEPQFVQGARVSANFFRLFGVRPAIGRTFTEAENRTVEHVIVLSDAIWRAQFNGDPAAIGQTLDIDGAPFTVIGVLPASFHFSLDAGLWMPIGIYPGVRAPRGSRGAGGVNVIARLTDGATLRQAQTELSGIAERLARVYPTTNADIGARLEPLQASLVQDVRPFLLLLVATLAFVLLITCANIAGLLVARTAARSRELAVRLSLGATRARLARQILTESLVLATIGGVAGLAGAALLVQAARRFTAFPVPHLDAARIDARVLLVAALLTISSGLFCGAAPVLAMRHQRLRSRLDEGGRAQTSSRRHRRLQSALTAMQAAIATALLAGAALTTQSLVHLLGVDPGFRTDHVLAADLSLSDSRYPRTADASRFYERVAAEVSQLPGVQRAALVSEPPLSEESPADSYEVAIAGEPAAPAGRNDLASLRWITPAYFATIGVRLRRGRLFDARDTFESTPVVVINEAMAHRFFGGREPLGRVVQIARSGAMGTSTSNATQPRTIIGIVDDFRQTSLADAVQPQIYLPYSQAITGSATLLVRTTADPLALAPAVREAVRRVDAEQPLSNLRRFDTAMDEALAPQRTTMGLLGGFAGIALLLALMGTYGLVAQAVRQRTSEIGVRVAVGATPGDVQRLLVSEGMRSSGAGAVCGLVGAVALAQLLRGLLYGISPFDPITLAAAAIGLVAAASCASWIPARRAARMDPIEAMRAGE